MAELSQSHWRKFRNQTRRNFPNALYKCKFALGPMFLAFWRLLMWYRCSDSPSMYWQRYQCVSLWSDRSCCSVRIVPPGIRLQSEVELDRSYTWMNSFLQTIRTAPVGPLIWNVWLNARQHKHAGFESKETQQENVWSDYNIVKTLTQETTKCNSECSKVTVRNAKLKLRFLISHMVHDGKCVQKMLPKRAI